MIKMYKIRIQGLVLTLRVKVIVILFRRRHYSLRKRRKGRLLF